MHRKFHRFGLGFNGIAKMLRFLLVVIDSDYSIEVLLSSKWQWFHLNSQIAVFLNRGDFKWSICFVELSNSYFPPTLPTLGILGLNIDRCIKCVL